MKKIILVLLMLLLVPTFCCASAPEIKFDKQRFDPLSGTYYLTGNVSVKVGSRLITADQAQVDLYALEVHAQGDIHLTQDGIEFYGDAVDVYGSKNTAEITGHINFIHGETRITADKGSFNWDTKNAVFNGNVKIYDKTDIIKKAEHKTYNIRDAIFLD
ncbi:MAG: organic solvent tolerance protein OstA [Acidaminococcaceae bacterium]